MTANVLNAKILNILKNIIFSYWINKFEKYVFPDQQSRHASGYYERVYSNEFPQNAHTGLRFGSWADNNCKGNTK